MLKINQNMFKRLMLLECDSLSFISGFEASQCDWVEFDHEESNPGRKEMQADTAILILPPPPPPHKGYQDGELKLKEFSGFF